eukprot:GHVU01129473.1.p1 GENE.GHVU01129473.1~~GHVU01129473.1.p1  ORF type:complete len:109 (+),score=2.12 GHVU01129473.1:252-578(+)
MEVGTEGWSPEDERLVRWAVDTVALGWQAGATDQASWAGPEGQGWTRCALTVVCVVEGGQLGIGRRERACSSTTVVVKAQRVNTGVAPFGRTPVGSDPQGSRGKERGR